MDLLLIYLVILLPMSPFILIPPTAADVTEQHLPRMLRNQDAVTLVKRYGRPTPQYLGLSAVERASNSAKESITVKNWMLKDTRDAA